MQIKITLMFNSHLAKWIRFKILMPSDGGHVEQHEFLTLAGSSIE